MVRVALKGLAGRKLRAALTMIAIVLGVAMVSGTYVLTDTIDKAFSAIFEESYANTDAVVHGAGSDVSFQGMTGPSAPVDADLLDDIVALDTVETASGSIEDEMNTKIIRPDGTAVNTNGAPSLGFGVDPEASEFNPLTLVEGRWARADDEVVLDAGTAESIGYSVGDRVAIQTLAPVREFELVGLAQFGDVASLGTATFAIFTLTAGQELYQREGQFDAISVAAVNGVTPEELVEDIRPILPDDAEVQTGQAQADEESSELGEITTFVRYFLLAFAGIALFVGAFVIFNTLSITVAQRTREFATLRTVGASRRQLLTSVIVEALVIGTIASVVGLFAGVGLAIGLNELFKALDADLPMANTVFALRTVIVSLAIGIGVTVLAGLFPALRATRVPPIAAVREGAELPPSRIARFVPFIAILMIGLAVASLAYAMFVDELGVVERLLSIAFGVLLLFIGVALVSKHAIRPLAVGTNPIAEIAVLLVLAVLYPFTLAFWLVRYGMFSADAAWSRRLLAFAGGGGILLLVSAALIALGVPAGFALVLLFVVVVVFAFMWTLEAAGALEPEWPAEFPNLRLGRRGSSIAKENARRNPQRTAATAAALMIGVALVTFVSVLANGMRESNRGAIEDQVAADYVLTAQDGFSPFVAGAGDALAESGSAELVTPVRAEVAEVAGEGQYLTGIETDRIADAYTFKWQDGSDDVLADLGRDGAIVAKDFAESNDLEVGSPLKVASPAGEEALLEVKAIYEPPPFYPILGAVSISIETFDSLYERPRNQFVFANVAGDPTDATTESLEAGVAGFPDAKVQTREQWITQQDEDFNQFLLMLYVLLALAVIISLFGMVNTLVLTVYERTRELGMLRAVGMTRRQTRRMVRHESVITALIGAALGVPLGIFLAILVTQALAQFDLQFAVPTGLLLAFAVIAVIVGILAAIAPARRAARLNVLEALQYE